MFNKFWVLKHDDIDKVLDDSPYLGNCLADLAEEIKEIRKQEGREINPQYIVINMDEPYINEVIEIMKRNEHWS